MCTVCSKPTTAPLHHCTTAHIFRTSLSMCSVCAALCPSLPLCLGGVGRRAEVGAVGRQHPRPPLRHTEIATVARSGRRRIELKEEIQKGRRRGERASVVQQTALQMQHQRLHRMRARWRNVMPSCSALQHCSSPTSLHLECASRYLVVHHDVW